jgi:hypothetical protein
MVRWMVACAVVITVVVAPGTAASAGVGGTASALRVGSQKLTRCGESPTAYCGTLRVPLAWETRGSPDISVCYRWYPAAVCG